MKATELLKKQHREVKTLFRRAKKADGDERTGILEEICQKLAHHMQIEEEIFYPAVQAVGTKKAEEMVPEAYEEHHVVKLVLDELPEIDPENERFEAKITVLDELIQHHVDEEEKEMFQLAEKLGDERLKELGAELEAAPIVAGGGQGEEEDEEMDEMDDEDVADDEDEDDEALEASAGAEGEEEYEEDEDDEDDYETEDQPTTAVGPTTRRGGSRG